MPQPPSLRNSALPKSITSTQSAAYKHDGFIAPVHALSLEEMAAFHTRFEAYEAANGGWYELSKGQKLYLLQTWAANLASHPRVPDAV